MPGNRLPERSHLLPIVCAIYLAGRSALLGRGRADRPISPHHSLYRFTCVYPVSSLYHGSQFRCMSAWATSKAVRVTHTNFIENSLAVETQTAQPNPHVFALAIVYVTTVCLHAQTVHVIPPAGANAPHENRLQNQAISRPALLKEALHHQRPAPPQHQPLKRALRNLGLAQVLLPASASGPRLAWLFWPWLRGGCTGGEGLGNRRPSRVPISLGIHPRWRDKWDQVTGTGT